MGKIIGLLVLLAWIAGSCTSEQKMLRHEYTVMSYNVENLFDTVDDPTMPDEEFLPGSEKQWTPERYQKKLDDLARVISEVNPGEAPEIVGLIEVENRLVLQDLILTGALKDHSYGIIHEESPDFRGIDVALIYRKDAFAEIWHETLPVAFPEDPDFKTRDILYVVGTARNQTFHLFVNHWPSRIGGEEQTEPKRVLAASVLKKRVDLILSLDPKANIIIMGDMNDEPVNKSLQQTIDAQAPESGARLVNLMWTDDVAGLGTYFYKGNWNMLDHLIVSGEMITGKRARVETRKGGIYSSEWMIFTNSNGDKTPNRSYVGNKYVGGVSDHFPVYFKMQIK